MKKLFFTFTMALFAITTNATVWIVNNNEIDENRDFDQIQTAIDSYLVAVGDTLYVQGSTDFYNDFNCNKRLTIIGPGYLLNENYVSANLLNAKVRNVSFISGSEGSQIIGMTIIGYSNDFNIWVNNITVKRCYINPELELGEIQGAFLINNYLNGGIDNGYSSSFFKEVNVINNIIGRVQTSVDSDFSIFENNILKSSSYSFNSAYFRNNIVLDDDPSFNINSGVKTNNIGTNGLFNDPNNFNVTNINDLFVGGESPDARYILSENSFAKGKGHDGADCGIFGGDNPLNHYILSGLPTIPVITELDTDGIGTKENGLNVKIGVKSF